MKHLIKSTEEMCDYIEEKYKDLENGCKRRLMYAYLSTLTQLVKCKKIEKEYKNRLMKYIKENRQEVLKDKRIPKRDRLALYATYLGFNFFSLSWKYYLLLR